MEDDVYIAEYCGASRESGTEPPSTIQRPTGVKKRASSDPESGLSIDHLKVLAAHFLHTFQTTLPSAIPQTHHPLYYTSIFHMHREANAAFQVQFANRADWANWRVRIMNSEVNYVADSLSHMRRVGSKLYEKVLGAAVPGREIVANKLAIADTLSTFAIEHELARLESEPFLIQPPLTQPIKRRHFYTILDQYEEATTLAGWHAYAKDRDTILTLQAAISRAREAQDVVGGIITEIVGCVKIAPPAMLSVEALEFASEEEVDEMEREAERRSERRLLMPSPVSAMSKPRGKGVGGTGKKLSSKGFSSPVSSDWTAAYPRCLDLEASAGSSAEYAQSRVLGYLLLEAPNHPGRNVLSHEINGCSDDEKLHKLDILFIAHYIRAWRNDATFASSSPPSQQPCQSLELPTYSNAKAKALIRDRHRCALSGMIDYRSFQASKSIRQEFANLSTKGEYRHMHGSRVWAVLERFSRGLMMIDKLDGVKIHQLENIINMSGDLHACFDELDVWLEEDQASGIRPTAFCEDIANHYKICAVADGLVQGYPTYVTFTTPDPEKLPLPSQNLLRLNAVCARVANFSGAGDYIDKITRDLEMTRVLPPGGDSESVELLFQASAPLEIA
ncbi:hypothetical protein BJ138DRAFT_1117258 [Hygrophoropsis aurantiaca]|uniref:Uncharacterized protein n=1 Tax=Hygrophoropsis aurantiaca TaxID=72124 RepID=A0ACB8A162_9AGAM|nr:hypothetical protein BJ138DRAFT_1117258 [Hygrophoropsis aurantiaca]